VKMGKEAFRGATSRVKVSSFEHLRYFFVTAPIQSARKPAA